MALLGADNLTIFGSADERTIRQMTNCLKAEEGARGVLCADNHLGYSQPIGGAVAYREHISPSGVGYDIGCGNKAVRTNVTVADIERKKNERGIAAVMDEIVRRVSFGMGRVNEEPVEHPVLDEIKAAAFAPQRQLYDLAAKQLGTVGAGNHYVDLFEDETGCVWIGVHFGSRGFGHKTASGFLALAQGKAFEERGSEGEMDSPPVVFPTESELGQAYIEAMKLAGAYAYAGRDVVVETVLGILGAYAEVEVHNHHNFAWREEHDGEEWWVVRKGCTPAFPGQAGFVGSTMGEESVILEGTEEGREAMFSTVHGAGRVMSRTEAAGRFVKAWSCTNRDHDEVFTTRPPDGICPVDGTAVKKVRGRNRAGGKIDWAAAREQLRADGIELRGGAADEAPGAYKRLNEVLDQHGDTIRILHRLRPLGVAMAGANTFDPFKD